MPNNFNERLLELTEEAEVIEFPTEEVEIPELLDKQSFALSLHDFFATVSEQPDWLVEGLIPAQSLTILAAKPKVGKSILTFNLAIALANKAKFLNRETMRCNVLIVQLEDPGFLIKDRLLTMGADISDRIYVRCQQTLTTADFKELKEFILEYGIGLVIIDPLIFAMRGNEQDASQTATFLRQIRELIFATKSAVLLVHHHRKSGGEHGDEMRGSSAILGAVDVALNLHREEEQATATLKVTSRFANVENEILTLDADNLQWRSAGSAQDYKKIRRENEILEILEDGSADVETLAEQLNLDRRRFRANLKNLVAQGLIIENKTETNGRPRSIYSIATNTYGRKHLNYNDQVKQANNDLWAQNSNPRISENAHNSTLCDMCRKPTTTRRNLNGNWVCPDCFKASKEMNLLNAC